MLQLGLTGSAWALVESIQARRRRAQAAAVPADARERRLANLRQLTFGGQNAEAYFDWTGTRLVFQSTRPPFGCDQIFTMRADGGDVRLVSTGKGRTTCAFFFPDGRRIIYASTHLGAPECPVAPDRSQGYVWPIYRSYEIFAADLDTGALTRLTHNDGYDAEGAVAPDGRRIVFTSLREGDLDLYTMDADGGHVRRLTEGIGYDGGPFFSWDGRHIVFRAARPAPGVDLDEYRSLLGQSLVRPRRLEIFYMRTDGSGLTQVTRNGAANFAPFMHPDSRQIVFSSNLHDPSGRSFSLYRVDADGGGLERLTWAESFASFPMFSRDGRQLVFCSNRGARAPRDLDIFIADWL
ncbi:MAG: PD40 domain-containing protein [Candidatus Rokubacteria bacterium]|nr:PD40 domain-containing protein [Candidatus Rokubacteria bacterium]MBI2526025.1 PD40 domain-containing protein [Candidatus Rokubacteria bacterium]